MSTQVTITLPDTVYGRAENLASMTGRSVVDILATTIELSLLNLLAEDEMGTLLAELSDEAVLALADMQMEPTRAQQLSHLLDRQQAGVLSDDERRELHHLMRHYHAGLLRKAQALQEAVKRGLRGALTP
ncbi:MAG: hypothetical protein HC884_03245 [Chloroflexaceae bacterium]|nr:hypothetical protein [Chloroflexaceae bacterium]